MSDLINDKKSVSFADSVTIHEIDKESFNQEKPSYYFDSTYYNASDSNIAPTEDLLQTEDQEDDEPGEAEELVSLINIFLRFYKVHYDESPEFNMFQNIPEDDPINTNKCIEMFQKHIDEYQDNLKDEKLIVIYDFDDEEYDFHAGINYVLTIKNKAEKLSHTLLALLKYITMINENDWIIDVIKTN